MFLPCYAKGRSYVYTKLNAPTPSQLWDSVSLRLLGVFFSSWRHSAWSSLFLELTFNVVERLAGLLGAG